MLIAGGIAPPLWNTDIWLDLLITRRYMNIKAPSQLSASDWQFHLKLFYSVINRKGSMTKINNFLCLFILTESSLLWHCQKWAPVIRGIHSRDPISFMWKQWWPVHIKLIKPVYQPAVSDRVHTTTRIHRPCEMHTSSRKSDQSRVWSWLDERVEHWFSLSKG